MGEEEDDHKAHGGEEGVDHGNHRRSGEEVGHNGEEVDHDCMGEAGSDHGDRDGRGDRDDHHRNYKEDTAALAYPFLASCRPYHPCLLHP